jgi:hypothetical protein
MKQEACRIENGSSFHSFGPEYVQVFLKCSVFAFGNLKFFTYNISERVRISIRQVLDFIFFINCNKTKCITVGTKQTLAFQNEELLLTINSEQLQHSACEKLLNNIHMKFQNTIIPVILSGGHGTRLWPLSRKQYPINKSRQVTQL